MGRGKNLLKEVLGEDQYQDYEAGLGITIQSPDGYVYRMHKANRSIHISRRKGSEVSAGDITGRDLYDSAAAFVTAAKLGNVNWACGSIRVELPSNMPPRQINFNSFILSGVSQILRQMFRLPRQIFDLLVTTESDDGPLVWIAFVCPVFLIFTLLAGMLKLPASVAVSFYIGMISFCVWIWYLRWKRKWGGETA